jgi:hypothetical protein
MTGSITTAGFKAWIGSVCLFLAAVFPAAAQRPEEQWRVIRGTSDLSSGVTGIRETGDGHLITVGAFYTPEGRSGISVGKLTQADGTTVWRTELPLTKVPTFAKVRDFAVDPAGNAYVICSYGKGSLIAKFLPSGKLAWRKTVKGLPRSIALDAGGNPAVFLMEGSSLKAGFSSAVAKYAAAKGGVLWKVTVAPARPGTSAPDSSGIAFDAAGNLIVATAGIDDVSSRCLKLEAAKGRIVWQRQFNAVNGDSLGIIRIAVDPAGDVVVAAARPVDAFSERRVMARLSGQDGSDVWKQEQQTTASLLYLGFDPAGRLDRVERTSRISNALLQVSKSHAGSGAALWTTYLSGPSFSVMSIDSGPDGGIAVLTGDGAKAGVQLVSPSGKLRWAGNNVPQDSSLWVIIPYDAELMNQRQVVALGDSVVMACARSGGQGKQHDFAKYGTPRPGRFAAVTSTGSDWQAGSSYFLGEVPIRSSYRTFPVIIQNRGEGDLVLSGFGVYFTRRIDAFTGDEFQFVGNRGEPRIIPPGGETVVTIRFQPKEAGLCTARLEMQSSDPEMASISIPLEGRGMGPRQEFEDWAVQHGMPANVSPDEAPHGDGVPLLLKFAFNLDPGRSDRRILTRDSGVAGLPLVTYEKKPGADGRSFRIEYLRRVNSKVTYRAVRAPAPGGPYQPVDFDQFDVTPVNGAWERVVGWGRNRYDKPAREFVRVEIAF